MADTTGPVDLSGWKQGLDKLDEALKVSLARSMAVAGGKVLRDEAKALAPVDDGVLKASIYLAYKDHRSTDQNVIYSITWNAKIAPHGHLLEFGHWQPYRVKRLPNGDFVTTKTKLASPKYVAARPFLGPAFHSGRAAALDAMIKRGQERLPQLLAGDTTTGEE